MHQYLRSKVQLQDLVTPTLTSALLYTRHMQRTLSHALKKEKVPMQ